MTLDTLLQQLHHPAVRDLAWLLGAPALLDETFYPIWSDSASQRLLQQAQTLLLQLEQQPAPLLAHLATRPVKRLGYYVENLLGFAFAHLPEWQIVAQHWPIRDPQRTVGELDFLLQASGQHDLLHLECAFKVYLQHQPQRGIQGFVGPGAKDQLHLKLDKLFQQQLPLSQHSSVTAQLDKPVGRRLAWLKGWLFYPWEAPHEVIHGLAAHHPHGWWQTLGSARQRLQQSRSQWILLPRSRWISPVWLAAGTPTYTGTQMSEWLEQHFANIHTPQLLVELLSSNSGMLEKSRGFVVDETWPEAHFLAK
jgi:hypothetical protein